MTISFGMSFLIMIQSLKGRIAWKVKQWPHVGDTSRIQTWTVESLLSTMRLSKGEHGPITLPRIRSANRIYSKQMYLDIPVVQVSDECTFSFTDTDMSLTGIVTSVFIRKAFHHLCLTGNSSHRRNTFQAQSLITEIYLQKVQGLTRYHILVYFITKKPITETLG